MKWEYRVRKIENIEQMNEYGQEEWELVVVWGDTAFYKRFADKQAEKQQVAQWEYKKTKIESIEQMNEYGQEGWELVAVSGYITFYKRPVMDIKEA